MVQAMGAFPGKLRLLSIDCNPKDGLRATGPRYTSGQEYIRGLTTSLDNVSNIAVTF